MAGPGDGQRRSAEVVCSTKWTEPLVARNKRGGRELSTRDDHPISWIVVRSGKLHGGQTDRCVGWQEMQTAQCPTARRPLATGKRSASRPR